MTAAISDASDICVDWMVHDEIKRAMNEERTAEREWAIRTASRLRQFVPETPHVPRHRAEVVAT